MLEKSIIIYGLSCYALMAIYIASSKGKDAKIISQSKKLLTAEYVNRMMFTYSPIIVTSFLIKLIRAILTTMFNIITKLIRLK